MTTFGAGAMTNSIGEIRAADFLMVIGSNTTEAHPVIAMEMKRAALRGATLVVCDPRRIWLADFADHHLQLAPGTDVWLLDAMAHVIIDEALWDADFVARHTEGFEAVVEAVRDITPERAEQMTGVPAELIRTVARAYATTEKAGIYYTLGITEHTHGTDNVYALSNLVLLTGHLGKPSAGLNPLRGQNNVQGANDTGASPVFLPGYQRVDDARARARFEAAWGVPVPEAPGLNLNQMMKGVAAGGPVRGLFVMGEDILVSEPDVARLEAGVKRLEALVVQDIFLTETAKYADVVLPATCFAEKEGTFTNSERRVQRVRRAVDAPGEARPDWAIIADLFERVTGRPAAPGGPAAIYDEMAGLTDKFGGISHARLDAEGGLQWPCPTVDHPGTRYLHADGPARGKALLMGVQPKANHEMPDAAWPLLLTTGRTLYHYNAGTQTRRVAGVTDKQDGCFVEVCPADAEALGLSEGDVVRVSTRRGAIEAHARVSSRVARGRLWMPFHFAEARANLLTVDAGDAVTGTGAYKVCACRVEPARP